MLSVIVASSLFAIVFFYLYYMFYYMDFRHQFNRRAARHDLVAAAEELGLKRKGAHDPNALAQKWDSLPELDPERALSARRSIDSGGLTLADPSDR